MFRALVTLVAHLKAIIWPPKPSVSVSRASVNPQVSASQSVRKSGGNYGGKGLLGKACLARLVRLGPAKASMRTNKIFACNSI